MHPGLTLINLKFFCDTAQRLSISEAARMNFVTQSAISQGIKKLEEALLVQLTNHSRHNMQLTQEGEIAFKVGRKILSSFAELQEAVHEQSTTLSGTLIVGCTPSIAMNFMKEAIRAMGREHPGALIEPKIGGPEDMGKWIKRGEVQVGLALASPEFSSFDQRVLWGGSFSVFSSGIELKNGVFVDRMSGLGVEALLTQYRKKYKKDLRILAELGSWELVAQFASDGLGCGFLPDFLSSRYTNLQSLPSIKPFAYELIACSNKGDVLSRASQAFFAIFSRFATS